MITLHHLEHSRSQRILWLLEELGVEYQINDYKRDPKSSLAPAELVAVHPLGKSPVIVDDDVTVAESGAIIEYLVEKYDDGTLLPKPGSPERRAYTYWLHYAEGSFMPLMIVALILNRIETAPQPFFVRPIAKRIVAKVRESYLASNVLRHLEFMESSLEKSAWFCGNNICAADIQMSFPLEAAEVRTNLKVGYPNLADFLHRVRTRPAYQRALEMGGPYELLGINKKG